MIRKYLFQLTFLLVVLEIAGYVVFQTMFSEYYFSLYPCIALFFFILGTVTVVSIANATGKESRKYFNAFMLMRTVKLISIIIAVALYAVLIRQNTVAFLFVFFIYYIIYSIFEASVSMKLNRSKNEFSQK